MKILPFARSGSSRNDLSSTNSSFVPVLCIALRSIRYHTFHASPNVPKITSSSRGSDWQWMTNPDKAKRENQTKTDRQNTNLPKWKQILIVCHANEFPTVRYLFSRQHQPIQSVFNLRFIVFRSLLQCALSSVSNIMKKDHDNEGSTSQKAKFNARWKKCLEKSKKSEFFTGPEDIVGVHPVKIWGQLDKNSAQESKGRSPMYTLCKSFWNRTRHTYIDP